MDLFLLCMLCLICLEFVFSPFTLYCKPFCLNQYLPHLFSKVLVLWHSQILKLLLTLMYVNNTVYFAALNSDHLFTAYFDFCIWSLRAWGISHFLTLFFSACVLLFSEFLKHACTGLFCWLHWAFSQTSAELPILFLWMSFLCLSSHWETNCPVLPFYHTVVYWLHWRLAYAE